MPRGSNYQFKRCQTVIGQSITRCFSSFFFQHKRLSLDKFFLSNFPATSNLIPMQASRSVKCHFYFRVSKVLILTITSCFSLQVVNGDKFAFVEFYAPCKYQDDI